MLAFTVELVAGSLRFIFASYEMLFIVFDKQKYRFYIIFAIIIFGISGDDSLSEFIYFQF